MNKTTILITGILLATTVIALEGDWYDAGTTFTCEDTNITYNTLEAFNCTNLILNNTCLIIQGGTLNGTYCNISSTPITINIGINNVALNNINITSGIEWYSLTWTKTTTDTTYRGDKYGNSLTIINNTLGTGVILQWNGSCITVNGGNCI